MSSYVVIARKWRPQTFDEVVGQPHVTRTLQNAVRLNRTAHAYLFTGARGVGKTSVARILAKALNCSEGPTPAPCGKCSNCREITQGSSVDVLEIDGASNRGIDNIRELRETVRYRPAKGRYKIYIIDEVHMLTPEAFNALLKTLEEPPAHVVFIFATTEPHKMPATILSRCQRFDFRRMTTQELVGRLKAITADESAEFSDNVLFAIAREADGSMRDAQSLLEQLLAFSGDGLPDEEILDILGVVDRRSILKACEAIISGDVRACLDVVEDLYRRGIDSRRFCQQLCDHFRNLLYLVVADKKSDIRLDLPSEEKDLLVRQAAQTDAESLYLYFQTALHGEVEIRRSSIPKIALEMLLFRMAQMPRLESLDAALETIGRIEKELTEDGGRRTEDRSRRTEDRGRKTEGGSQRTEDREQRSEAGGRKTEVGEQKAETGRQRPEMGSRKTKEHGGEAGLRSPSSDLGDPSESNLPGPTSDLRPPFNSVPRHPSSDWPDFLGWIEARDPVLGAKLAQSRAAAESDDLIRVEVMEIFEKSMSEPDAVAKLNSAAADFFGRGFNWAISRKSAGPHEHESKRSKAGARKHILEHPAVLQAIEILGGDLVEVKTHGPKEPARSRGGRGPAPRSAG